MQAARETGLWKRGVLWLLLLGPLFFASYGFANWLTAQREDVGSLVFTWESAMPLWPWSIVPYWSIDLLYGLSFLLPATRREMDRHALRLLTAQVICVACFLLWPLRFTFERPELDGFFGWMFDVLMGFDKPFNQAPSLHIALLVVIWVMFARHTRGLLLRGLLHGWMALIGLSVLTTWQHHFIDVPTGALAGWLCVWLWPIEDRSPLHNLRLAREPQRWRLALRQLFAVAPVQRGHGATQRHDQATKPDPGDKGFVVHPHRPGGGGAVFQFLTERHIHIARQAALDGGFGHGHGGREIHPLFRVQCGQQFVALQQFNGADIGVVVGATPFTDAGELEGVTPDHDRVTERHANVFFGLVTLDHGDADHGHRDADVRHMHAPEGQGGGLTATGGFGVAVNADHRGQNDPDR